MAATILDKRIAIRVMKARAELALSQCKLAKLAGVHRNTLNRIERAEGCSVESLYKLARTLEMSVDSLVEYRKPRFGSQLELWPNKERMRPPYARKPVQSDVSRGSNGLYALPARVGSQ